MFTHENKIWTESAPSNIALIKYMGKERENIPMNVSLSYTLPKFITTVSLQLNENCDEFINEDRWGIVQIERFINHLKYIKDLLNFNGFFRIKSHNNFPHSVGIASSASSFAALTKVVCAAICEIQQKNLLNIDTMSKISRHGSGSSCRSFFSPWSIWEGESARSLNLKIGDLEHDLILVTRDIKKTSSSQAHKLVKSSLLFQGRKERAETRYQRLIDAFNCNNWKDAYQICWEEFHDMHTLFETSSPHFSYILPQTISILNLVEEFWREHNNGPIVTLDAGPNIHLLWNNPELHKKFLHHNLSICGVKCKLL